MGAELVLSCLPSCKLTDERLAVLDRLIDSLQLGDFEDRDQIQEDADEGLLPFGVDAIVHRRNRLKAALRDYPEPCRSVVNWQLHGCPIPYLITGGMTWGDNPSGPYPKFQLLGSAGRLFEQLYAFALEDIQDAGAVP